MNKKLKWIIAILVIIIIVFVVLSKSGKLGNQDGIKVVTEKTNLKTIIETVNASGKLYPEIEVKVSPDISGEIVELYVEEGDNVTKGQPLAKIYADIYITQRDQVLAGLNQAKAQVSNTVANLEGLKFTLENSKKIYDRQKKLLEEKVISKAEFETAEQNYNVANANINAAKESIKSNEAFVQNAQAQLNRANKDLSRTTIISPMTGIISLMSVKKGERVVGTAQFSGTEILRVADMKSIEVRVDVGENDITKVKIGDTALVEVDAYNNRKFKGIVYKIANPNVTTTTTTNEVTNYKVHIRIFNSEYTDLVQLNKKFPFRPGMTVNADIQTKRKENVLSIPLPAVTTREIEKQKKSITDKIDETNKDKDIDEVCFVLDKNNIVRKKIVKTGIQDINNIEILSGLKEGDEVVTGPYLEVSKLLKDSTKVKVVSKEEMYSSVKKN